MGKYTQQMSQRIQHARIEQGYCLICGIFGRLSQDHVPPKSCVTIKPTEQKLITEVLGIDQLGLKGVRAKNGSSFRTICRDCNGKLLGPGDNLAGVAYKSLTRQTVAYFQSIGNFYHFASTPIEVLPYARAMIGHILSATTIKECLAPPVPSDYFDPLKKFVLGDDTALADTHDIYYWFYPRDMHLSAKLVTFHNKGHIATVSVLSFFPVAFMVTKKNEGTYPAQAVKLEMTDRTLTLNLSSANAHYADFPFVPLSGDRFYALNAAQAIASYTVSAE